LNLARIEGIVARGTDFAEVVHVVEIRRTGDSIHTVAAESRLVEIRMVQNVEELCPELQPVPFSHLEVLEQ